MIAVQKDLNIEPKHKDGPILNQEAENTKLWDKNAHADVRCLMSGLRRQAGSDTRSASSSPPPPPPSGFDRPKMRKYSNCCACWVGISGRSLLNFTQSLTRTSTVFFDIVRYASSWLCPLCRLYMPVCP